MIEKDQMDQCNGEVMNLTQCLLWKWNATSNGIDSLKEIHDELVDHQPDIISIDINLWFWFRIKWYGKDDPIDYRNMDDDSLMKEYTHNVTEFFNAFQQYLPNVSTWAMTTAITTTPKSRVKASRVSLVNEAIRNFTNGHNNNNNNHTYPTDSLKQIPTLVDWDEMTKNLPRDKILHDGVHGKYFFNRAIGNVYLNALAAAAAKSTSSSINSSSSSSSNLDETDFSSSNLNRQSIIITSSSSSSNLDETDFSSSNLNRQNIIVT